MSETTPPLKLLDNDPALTKAIDDVRACNDRLGAYSDHEGNMYGSSWYFWNKGADAFADQCDRAIADHHAAIRAWRHMRQLNSLRSVKAKR